MKVLRYSLFLLLFAGFGLTASAQLSIGGGVAYNFDAERVGINVRGVYSITDAWRGQAGFVYYFAPENVNLSEINLNANYVFADNGSGTKFYGLAGLNFFRVSTKAINTGVITIGKVSATKTGFNVGAGANLGLSDNISLYGEAKYIISDFDGLGVVAGLLYHF